MYTEWYRHIRGFKGHRYWGTLEPFISMKSILAGGSCKIASDIETAHIFKSRPSHSTKPHDLVYNKMLAAKVLFSDPVAEKFINFLCNMEVALQGVPLDPAVRAAKMMIGEDIEMINEERDEFRKVKKHNIYWWKEKYNFKDYGVL